MGKKLNSEYKHMLNVQDTNRVKTMIKNGQFEDALNILDNCIRRNKKSLGGIEYENK